MRKLFPATILVAIIAALSLTGQAVASGSCSDSWGSDGHTGPWYTSSNSTLHGNTLVISCPGSGTSWSVTYQVAKIVNGTVSYPINISRSGTGSTSFSVNASPLGCSSGAPYYTHVHNKVTGGDIYKPSSKGQIIC